MKLLIFNILHIMCVKIAIYARLKKINAIEVFRAKTRYR